MKKFLLILGPTAGLGLSLLFTSCGKHEADHSHPGASEMPTVAVRVLKTQESRQWATEDIVGTVRAKTHATLEAKISGRISALSVIEGQSVAVGQTLLQMEDREVRAQLDQARAQHELAQREQKRAATMFTQEAVTRQTFDEAEARASETGAAVDEAMSILAHAEITAPFDGVITRKHVEVGDLAFPGKALLTLENPAALRLEAPVPESIIDRVQIGQVMAVRLPALEFETEGTVVEIAPAADPASRTFTVKWDLPSAGQLRSGLFARVALPIQERTALLVPAAAVVQRGQMQIVFVADQGTARLRLVKTGPRKDNQIELLAGLRAGETIVVEGAGTLRDGQPLEMKP